MTGDIGMDPERMQDFIRSLEQGNTGILSLIEQEALKNYVPIIRREMQGLLKLLLQMQRPQKILEVGTAVGFSAIFMSEYNPVDCEIITIENYEKRIPIARKNIQMAGKEQKIQLIPGDALQVLKELQGSFPMIFMDAAKGQYIHFLPDVLRLLAPGGILLTDNVFQEGEILESRFVVSRRNRTIHKRMRQYLYEITHHQELVTTILPVADGVAISYKKREPEEKISE